MRAPENPEAHELIGEQIAYYRAIAAEYEDHVLDEPGGDELIEALEEFRPVGRTLELACGTGLWTRRLLRFAESVTAVDAAPEMIMRAKVAVPQARLWFIEADIFEWQPELQYDVVFFAFWLSHVPLERFEAFWALVADCLEPDGRVFFVDDAYRTPEELIEGEESSTIQRRLNDGTPHLAVKVPHEPADLERRIGSLGWRATVTPTRGPFFWGTAERRADNVA